MRRLIALALFLGGFRPHAEPLRVTTWNLNFSPLALSSAPDRTRLSNIASVLSGLRPDVVLLQEVPDRLTCELLVALLGPSRYQVAACSGFTDSSGRNRSQVAVLSKLPVAASWTESWKPEGWVTPAGGLAGAAIRHEGGLVLVYSVQLKNNAEGDNPDRDTQITILERELSSAQLVRHVGTIEASLTNQPAAVLVGGSLNTNPDEPQFVSEGTLRLLAEAGFTNAFAGTPFKNRITRRGSGREPDSTSDYFFARHAAFSRSPTILASALSGHFPVTCDLFAGRSPALASAPPTGQWLAEQWPWTILSPGVLLLLLLAGWWFVSRKRFYSPAQAADAHPAGLLPFPAEATADVSAKPELPEENGSGLEHAPAEIPAAAALQSRIQSLEMRAVAAEERAALATELVRKGLVPQLSKLMKDRLFKGVVAQRAHLVKIQQAGAAQVAELERRLMRIQAQLQNRLSAYERRIAELENEVSAKDRLNRELLASRIELVKQVLEAAEARREANQERSANPNGE